jgi:poly-gamma-glutamate synthesis protein (capsule biosynthesis protein)
MNNSPEALALLLQKAGQSNGLTVLTTANNHSMDQGVEGLVATLDLLDELQVLHVGTARSTEERDALLLVDVQGFKLAFLSWTYSLNNKSLSDGQGHLANTLRLNLPDVDLSPITAQVAEARQRGADFVILCLHWGLENEKFPLASQIEKAHRLCESGVDIICGNHPHTTQPAERYTWVEQQGDREVQRESLILYALGDFVSPLAHLNLSSVTNMVETLLVRGVDGRVVIQDVTIKPLYAC